ncbi:MAG: hypothetical protein IKB93_13800 [Clostridia bacterium]|nr:hypothetical protein [Clostridia bacterium]
MIIILRLLYIVAVVALFYCFIYFCITFKRQGSKIKALISLVLFCLLCFFGTGYHERPANVSKKSLECIPEYSETLDCYKDYYFELKNLSGRIDVWDDSLEDEDNSLEEEDEFFLEDELDILEDVEGKVGITENGVEYIVSKVSAGHHEQAFYMWYPTAAAGEIHAWKEGKSIYIYYYYTDGHPLGFLWGIISPDYFYAREIDVEEILSNAVPDED